VRRGTFPPRDTARPALAASAATTGGTIGRSFRCL